MAASAKTERQLERIVRGFANHRRIQMLRLLESIDEMAVEEVARKLGINVKTASEHLRRLAMAGLVAKRNHARFVRHTPTPRGRQVLGFLRAIK